MWKIARGYTIRPALGRRLDFKLRHYPARRLPPAARCLPAVFTDLLLRTPIPSR